MTYAGLDEFEDTTDGTPSRVVACLAGTITLGKYAAESSTLYSKHVGFSTIQLVLLA